MNEAVLLAVGAAAAYGVADFLGGLHGRRLQVVPVMFVSHVAGFAVLASAMVMLGAPGAMSSGDVAWGAASGVAALAGGFFLLRAFAVGRFSVVSTVAALTGAALPLAVDVLLGARPSALAWAGLVLGLGAIALVTLGDADRVGHSVAPAAGTWLAALSGVGYAGMYLLLDFASPESGLWPALSREAGVVVLTGLLATLGRWNPWVPRAALAGVSGIGVAASLGTASFLLAARLGQVGIAAVIASLSPAVTIVLARLLLAEAVTRQQVLGLVGAGVALVLIGLS